MAANALSAFRDLYGRPLASAGALIERHAPDFHRAAAVTAEEEVLAIGRPYGVPVCCGIISDFNRISTGRGDCPQIALTALARETPESDALSIG